MLHPQTAPTCLRSERFFSFPGGEVCVTLCLEGLHVDLEAQLGFSLWPAAPPPAPLSGCAAPPPAPPAHVPMCVYTVHMGSDTPAKAM